MTAGIIVLLILFAFGATFIQRVTGFGFGLCFMTIAPFLMPTYGEATALSGMLALMCAIGSGAKLLKCVPWKKLTGILVTFLIVSFFCIRMVAHIDSKLIIKFLGGVLIALSLYFTFLNGKIRKKPSVPVLIGMGTISGTMGGLFAMQGPPAVIYFISCTDSKEEYMAITQWYFIIGNSMMTIFRAGNNFITPTVGLAWVIGVPAVFLGLWLGSKVYEKMPITTIRKFVYAFIGISGIVALFR